MSEVRIYEALFTISDKKQSGLNFYKCDDGLIIESWITDKPIRRYYVPSTQVALEIIPKLRERFEDKKLEALKDAFIIDLEDPELKKLKTQFIIPEEELKE